MRNHKRRSQTDRSQAPVPAPFTRTLLAVCLLALGLLSVGLLPGCTSGLIGAAYEAEKAGDYEAAVGLYREQLKQNPQNEDAVKGLAVDLFLLGEFDEALAYQERAVQAEPDDVQLKVELAFNYLNHQGRPGKAVEVLKDATRLESTARVLTFLAQAQLAAGQVQDAEASLRSAIGEDQSYSWAYALLVGLLAEQGRQAEADAVRQAASAAGVVLQPAP